MPVHMAVQKIGNVNGEVRKEEGWNIVDGFKSVMGQKCKGVKSVDGCKKEVGGEQYSVRM